MRIQSVGAKLPPEKMARSAEPGRKAAYSVDLRWRVVWQRIVPGNSFRQIADNLNIAHSTASLMRRQEMLDPPLSPSVKTKGVLMITMNSLW